VLVVAGPGVAGPQIPGRIAWMKGVEVEPEQGITVMAASLGEAYPER
jgi:hypothetical protein